MLKLGLFSSDEVSTIIVDLTHSLQVRRVNLIPCEEIMKNSGKLTIAIGGVGCSILSDDPHFLDQIRSHYLPFESSVPPLYEVMLQPVSTTACATNGEKGLLRPIIKPLGRGGNYLIVQPDNSFSALVNTLSRKALVKMSWTRTSLDSFLRIFYGLVLPNEGGLLVNASSIGDGRQGSLFLSPPECGGTTVARPPHDYKVLGDGLSLVTYRNGRPQVHWTPFAGDPPPGRTNMALDLCAVYSLRTDRRNVVTQLDKARAATELYRTVLLFTYDISLLGQVLDTCYSLVHKIPVYQLRFTPDRSLWQVISQKSSQGTTNHAG